MHVDSESPSRSGKSVPCGGGAIPFVGDILRHMPIPNGPFGDIGKFFGMVGQHCGAYLSGMFSYVY